MIEIQRDPKPKDLLVFGLLFPPFLGFVGWRLLVHEHATAAYAAWALDGVLLLAYLASAKARKAVYVGWLTAVFPIGWVVSHVIVIVFYYLVVTPIGVLMRLFGRDSMNRRKGVAAGTYWTDKEPVRDSKRYFQQY